MLAQESYDATAVGHAATIRFNGATDDREAWEEFAVEVRMLEHMARQGLLTVTFRHIEGQTGKSHVDMVTFTRL